MKILADENVDQPIIDSLIINGFTVLYVKEMAPGISDDAVIHIANSESALVLTADKDFGELVFRQKRTVHGVILFRLAGLSPKQKAEKICWAINNYSDKLTRNFTVITHKTIRIRKSTN
ncbi:MAG: DUF5615 family PIN-like protein [bacterium]